MVNPTPVSKDKDHTSNTYNNAAMPYTERLTWDGVALHAGGLPGHANEQGQALTPAHAEGMQMPPRFAKTLYEILTPGTTLLVTDAPVLEQQKTGVALNIINSDPPDLTDSEHRYFHAL